MIWFRRRRPLVDRINAYHVAADRADLQRDHGRNHRLDARMKRLAVFVAVTVFLVALTWMCVLAAGTPWAILVAVFAVGVAFFADRFDQRPSKLTPLQRFEQRQERRAA